MGARNTFAFPVKVQGAGQVTIGGRNSFGYALAPKVGSGSTLLQPRIPVSNITIGDRNSFSNDITIISMSSISIGNDCLIGDMVSIFDCDFHEIDPARRRDSCGKKRPVMIGNNVWIGSRAMILKGAEVGDNSVVAAMSVVTRAFPENVILAGAPAKIVSNI
ncbi:MAG: acyltransferase [bacterium]|nr:acyltransferase [bacterium]